MEAPANAGSKRKISRNKYRTRHEGLGGSEEEVRLGHRCVGRVPASEGLHVEGKIAPREEIFLCHRKSFRISPDPGSGRSFPYEALFTRALIQMDTFQETAD